MQPTSTKIVPSQKSARNRFRGSLKPHTEAGLTSPKLTEKSMETESINGCEPRIAGDAAVFATVATVAVALGTLALVAGIVESATERSMVISYFSAVGILGVFAVVAFRNRNGKGVK